MSDLAVVDLNPQVNEKLKERGVKVIYGDISQRDTLVHAGIPQAQILICSLPDSVLKGMNNRKLLKQLRDLNPTSDIIVHAEQIWELKHRQEEIS